MTSPEPTRRPLFQTRDLVLIAVLAALLITVCVVRLLVGETFGWPGWRFAGFRAYRLAIGLTAGTALAIAGTLLQALLRNPLASPYIIGVSSGAALGVVFALVGTAAGWFAWLGTKVELAQPVFALVAALGTLGVIYLLAQKRGWIDPLGLLLVGVIVNAIIGAIIMFVHYWNPGGLGVPVMQWMMGHFREGLPSWIVSGVAVVVVSGSVVAVLRGRAIDVATFSDAEAQGLGLHLPRLRLAMFAIAGVLTAMSVMLVGPIGFVGLICPHLVRLIVGPRHVPLLIGAALCGATLLVLADTLIVALDRGQGRMPVGVITAIIGGPVFLWMLRPQLGRGAEA